ncbi:MAG: lysophospholipid acyltransferase family protein [Alphaproteobacteria bacterium]
MTVRGVLFATVFYGLTLIMAVAYIPLMLLPDRWFRPFAVFWLRTMLWTTRWIGGISWSIDGVEHLPNKPFLVISKHQSAWETLALTEFFDMPSFVLKQELTKIPLFGVYLRKTGHVAVDRSAGMAALKQMTVDAKARTAENRVIVIFPEGTRTAPGQSRKFLPGAAALYSELGLPCVPAALNSGSVWPKKLSACKPGHISLQFLEPFPPGLDRRTFLQQASERINEATHRLENSNQAGSGAV